MVRSGLVKSYAEVQQRSGGTLPCRCRADRAGRRSHREALASLRPAGTDDRPAGLGRHPLAETVCLGALAHVGLVRPFHPSTSFLALDRGLVSRSAGGPVTRDWAFDVHARPKRARVSSRSPEAPSAGTVYRSDPGERYRTRRPGSCPGRSTNNRSE